MTYELILFLHLCALIAAFCASTLLHFIEARERTATTRGEVRQWHDLMARVVVVFPVAMLTLVASGGYLVHARWSWQLGWVQAGVVGVVLLAINGPIVAGGRHRRIQRYLDTAGEGPVTPELAAMLRDRVMRAATWANTGIALGVALAMTVKPSLAGSLAIIAIAMIAGACIPLRSPRARSASPAG